MSLSWRYMFQENAYYAPTADPLWWQDVSLCTSTCHALIHGLRPQRLHHSLSSETIEARGQKPYLAIKVKVNLITFRFADGKEFWLSTVASKYYYAVPSEANADWLSSEQFPTEALSKFFAPWFEPLASVMLAREIDHWLLERKKGYFSCRWKLEHYAMGNFASLVAPVEVKRGK